MQAELLEGGFADAPIDAAHAFRAAMRAMARPGTIEQLDVARPPAGLSIAAGSLLLTLCDHETGIYLAGPCDSDAIRRWLGFHTGAPLVAASQAQFVVGPWQALVPLEQYRQGTPEYPDRSATLIVEMPEIRAQGSTLRGPGIKDSAQLSLPDPDVMRANNAQFPLGLDFFLTSGAQVAALPRSTHVEAG